MSQLEFSEDEWKKYVHTSAEHYTRNLVKSKDFTYDLILLAWLPGQKSAIHDHKDSGCWMRILNGQLVERRYSEQELGVEKEIKLNLVSETISGASETIFIDNNRGVHSVENNGKEICLSLHLYSPPITECRVWAHGEEETPSIFKASFHSIFGFPLPQHMFKPSNKASLGGKYWPLKKEEPSDKQLSGLMAKKLRTNPPATIASSSSHSGSSSEEE